MCWMHVFMLMCVCVCVCVCVQAAVHSQGAAEGGGGNQG